jgi:hypothetical protein
MKKIVFVLSFCVFASTLTAQVDFYDPSTRVVPKETAKKWEHMKVFRPYDSLHFVVQPWPTVGAYKKYVGQMLFLLAQQGAPNKKYYANNMATSESEFLSPKEIIMLSTEAKKGQLQPYMKGKLDQITNQYYIVIDVVNYLDSTQKVNPRFAKMKQLGYRKYVFPSRDDESKSDESPSDVPCFVLIRKGTNDTCYTAFPEKFLVVGAFSKVQEQFQNASLKFMLRKPNNEIHTESWRCVKVAVASRDFYNYPAYEGLPTVSLIIQNDNGVQKAVPVKEYYNQRWWLTEAPVSVSDMLAQKKAAEGDQECCTDLVKELERKYSATEEIKETAPTTNVDEPVEQPKKPKKRVITRNNKTRR